MKERVTHILLGIVAILLAAHLFVGVTKGQAREETPAQDVVRARLIELVDAQGQTRAQLKVEEDGEAVFRMRDAQGAIRVKLSAAEDGSGLLLAADSTEPAIHLLAKSTGTTLILAEKGREKKVLAP